MIPALLSKHTQKELLSYLLHENLANPHHRTNVHWHHHLPYHAVACERADSDVEKRFGKPSFFSISPDSALTLQPISPAFHKPFTVKRFLSRKLRWLTLGTQYDWTDKMYPSERQPAFPLELGKFIQHLFPSVTAEAAIVNVYHPGDVLSMHRDVSEESDNTLISLSLGCQGILIIGLEATTERKPCALAVRLHSGDAVCLSGSARFAWHGVSQVLPNTCPSWLQNWPASAEGTVSRDSQDRHFDSWRCWMKDKRVNLSVRQVRPH